jgi:hypothetical protein
MNQEVLRRKAQQRPPSHQHEPLLFIVTYLQHTVTSGCGRGEPEYRYRRVWKRIDKFLVESGGGWGGKEIIGLEMGEYFCYASRLITALATDTTVSIAGAPDNLMEKTRQFFLSLSKAMI